MRWPWSRPALAYLGLGSNVGDRLDTLRSAIAALDTERHIEVQAVSTVYETAPVTGPEVETAGVEVDPYLNLVAAVSTTLRPRQLLATCQTIEGAHGRDRRSELRWGPRTLDIDVLLYDHRTVDEPGLVVPHPRLTERPFVLVPLAEVLPPGATLPDGSTVTAHLARLVPIEGIEPHVRLLEGPGSGADPLTRRPPGPVGGPPRLARHHGGPGRGGSA